MEPNQSREMFVRKIITALLFSVVFVLALGVRLTWLSSSYVSKAMQAANDKKIELAFDYYNRAIRNYYPGNPYTSQAVNHAIKIIESESKNVNNDLQQLRGSLLSIRSLYQPYRQEIEWIENKLTENTE